MGERNYPLIRRPARACDRPHGGGFLLAIGIDPGTATTGYGVVSLVGQKLEVITLGVIRTSASWNLADRLLYIHDQVSSLCHEYKPDLAAMEELFFNRNVRSALAVGQARGAVLVALSQAGLPVLEFTPLQVKQAVTGYGRAGKQQVQQMVQRLLHLDELPRPDDAADALACAICGLHSAGYAALGKIR